MKHFPQLCDHDWICDFVYFTVISERFNELKANLQESNHVINEMFGKITAFERKLRLWAILR
jgi:hypothetical protein